MNVVPSSTSPSYPPLSTIEYAPTFSFPAMPPTHGPWTLAFEHSWREMKSRPTATSGTGPKNADAEVDRAALGAALGVTGTRANSPRASITLDISRSSPDGSARSPSGSTWSIPSSAANASSISRRAHFALAASSGRHSRTGSRGPSPFFFFGFGFGFSFFGFGAAAGLAARTPAAPAAASPASSRRRSAAARLDPGVGAAFGRGDRRGFFAAGSPPPAAKTGKTGAPAGELLASPAAAAAGPASGRSCVSSDTVASLIAAAAAGPPATARLEFCRRVAFGGHGPKGVQEGQGRRVGPVPSGNGTVRPREKPRAGGKWGREAPSAGRPRRRGSGFRGWGIVSETG